MSINSNDDSNPVLTKRTKTSPRTNMINEVAALIDTHIKAWSTVSGTAEGTGATDALTQLRSEVSALVGTQHNAKPKSVKVVKEGAVEVEGIHFVGESSDGTLVYLHGVYKNTDSSVAMTHVWGPFRTENGAKYAIQNKTHTTKPQVF